MKECSNTGFDFHFFPWCICLGFTIDLGGLWKTNYSRDANNCRRFWICFNLLFFQISYNGVWKEYKVEIVKGE
jgi:hypothetical protein